LDTRGKNLIYGISGNHVGAPLPTCAFDTQIFIHQLDLISLATEKVIEKPVYTVYEI
jgi:hypothetical protein